MEKLAKCFNPRPLALFCALYAFGVYSSRWVDAVSFLIVLLLLAAGVILFAVLSRLSASLFALALLFGFFFGARAIGSRPAYIPPREYTTVTGRVSEMPESEDTEWNTARTRLVLDNTETAGGEKLGRIWLDVYGGIDAGYGDIVTASARIKNLKANGNPNCFDYRMYARNRGVSFYASASSKYCTYEEGRTDFYGTLINVRSHLEKTIQAIAPQNGATVAGMLLGYKTSMSEEELSAFQTAGLSHILSVSGLHVAYITAALYFILKKCKNRKLFLIIPVILFLYCAVTAFPSSIIRASIMGAVMVIASVWGYRNDPLTSLSLAMLLILIANPLQAFDVGFQMSFAAAYGIVLLSPQIQKWFLWLHKSVRSLLAVSIGAQAAVVPISLLYFNQLYPYSLLANLVFVPLFGVVVIAGFIGMALGAVWPVLGLPFGFLCDLVLAPALWVMRLIETLPGAALSVPSPPAFVIGTALLIILICSKIFLAKTPIKRNLCLVLIALSLLPVFAGSVFRPQGLTIRVLDVGQGNCAVIETPDDKVYLVDTGPNEAAKEYLLKNGRLSVDGVIFTHLHDDHAGGLESLEDCIRIEKLYVPQLQEDEIDQCRGKEPRACLQAVQAGDIISLGKDVSIEIKGYYGGEEDASMAFQLNYGTFSMLFTGDVDGKYEKELAKQVDPCQALLVGHHGSKASSSEQFLLAVQPETAVISAGLDNGYGHPGEDTLERLKDAGSAVYRTDIDGMITLYVSNNKVTVSKYLHNLWELL
ncbi:MAG: DNA internalization-related competence protein ComEC/Rec2 [Christensenellales bacterium]